MIGIVRLLGMTLVQSARLMQLGAVLFVVVARRRR